MSREIKFRMFRDGRMQGVHTMYSKGSHTDSVTEPQDFAFSDGEILMQFTGLKDKNGKEIYEGDIVRLLVGASSKIGWPFQVIFEFGSFQLKSPIYDSPIAFISMAVQCIEHDMCSEFNAIDYVPSQLEVIGNIYDNPELLKPLADHSHIINDSIS